jgi:plasmid stabilization system protein ParE
MARLKIIWSPEAESNLANIFNYYNTRNGNKKYSNYVNRKIIENLRIISRYPGIFPLVVGANTRSFPCEHFRIFYSIHAEHLLVEAIFDTRQDPQKSPY